MKSQGYTDGVRFIRKPFFFLSSQLVLWGFQGLLFLQTEALKLWRVSSLPPLGEQGKAC